MENYWLIYTTHAPQQLNFIFVLIHMIRFNSFAIENISHHALFIPLYIHLYYIYIWCTTCICSTKACSIASKVFQLPTFAVNQSISGFINHSNNLIGRKGAMQNLKEKKKHTFWNIKGAGFVYVHNMLCGSHSRILYHYQWYNNCLFQ